VTLFEPLLAALTASGTRFVVVGGVAVVLHGHPRFTADLDVALDLTADDPRRAVDALTAVGLAPLMPVEARDFADPANQGAGPMTDWDAGGWAGARQAQEDAWLATTPAQRLAWLEDATDFARTALVAASKPPTRKRPRPRTDSRRDAFPAGCERRRRRPPPDGPPAGRQAGTPSGGGSEGGPPPSEI
jgi:hypothetical protein